MKRLEISDFLDVSEHFLEQAIFRAHLNPCQCEKNTSLTCFWLLLYNIPWKTPENQRFSVFDLNCEIQNVKICENLFLGF